MKNLEYLYENLLPFCGNDFVSYEDEHVYLYPKSKRGDNIFLAVVLASCYFLACLSFYLTLTKVSPFSDFVNNCITIGLCVTLFILACFFIVKRILWLRKKPWMIKINKQEIHYKLLFTSKSVMWETVDDMQFKRFDSYTKKVKTASEETKKRNSFICLYANSMTSSATFLEEISLQKGFGILNISESCLPLSLGDFYKSLYDFWSNQKKHNI